MLLPYDGSVFADDTERNLIDEARIWEHLVGLWDVGWTTVAQSFRMSGRTFRIVSVFAGRVAEPRSGSSCMNAGSVRPT